MERDTGERERRVAWRYFVEIVSVCRRLGAQSALLSPSEGKQTDRRQVGEEGLEGRPYSPSFGPITAENK